MRGKIKTQKTEYQVTARERLAGQDDWLRRYAL